MCFSRASDRQAKRQDEDYDEQVEEELEEEVGGAWWGCYGNEMSTIMESHWKL